MTTFARAADVVLVAASRRLSRTAAHLVSARQRVLARCAADVGRCAAEPSAACRDATARRCRRRVEWLSAVSARVTRAGNHAATGLGPSLFDADDGLGYALLVPFCPGGPAEIDDVTSATACRQRALDCTADRTIALLAPQAAPVLAAIDGRAPSCFGQTACGDGIVDEDEECDDGDGNSDVLPDHCRTTCRDPDCGDGVVDEDEECDDGNAIDGDGCDADCESEVDTCGNGVVDEDEECDDGNAIGGDGCDAECTIDTSVCGDGVESDDEECDDGDRNSDVLPDHCRTTCHLPSCGDGIVDPEEGEECEPPGTILCTADCERRFTLPVERARNAPAPLGRCARAILHRGSALFSAARAAIGGCVQAAAGCVLVEDAPDRCFAAATHRCHRAAARRDRLRAALRTAVGRTCAGPALGLTGLLDPDYGLGFRDIAASCAFDAAREPTADDLLDCIAARVGCLAERAITAGTPRAYDFLSEVVDDPEAEFPCILDPEEVSSPGGAFLDPPGR